MLNGNVGIPPGIPPVRTPNIHSIPRKYSHMHALCESCGNEWTLQKDPAEYTDGPRCSECQARDVTLDRSPESDATEAAAAFEALEEGKDPVDIVRLGIANPDRAEALTEEYARLSEYELLTQEEITEMKTQARKDGYEAGKKEGRKQGKKHARREMERQAQQHLEAAYERGYRHGQLDEKASGSEQELFDIEQEM